MPDKKGNLYLFEAIELRKEYDRRIKLLEHLLGGEEGKQDRLFRSNEPDFGVEPDFEEDFGVTH